MENFRVCAVKFRSHFLVFSIFASLVLTLVRASAQFTFTKVVDTTDVFPGQGAALVFNGQSLTGNTVLFKAQLLNGTVGVYTATVGVPGVSKIVDNHDTTPDGGGYGYDYLSTNVPAGANVALGSSLGSTTAIYTGSVSAFVPTRLVGSGDPVPGHGTFTNVGDLSISGNNVVFKGVYGAGLLLSQGLYAGTVGIAAVAKIVEVGDSAPGSAAFGPTSFFNSFPVVSGNNIAFLDGFGGGRGIFTATVGVAGATKLADTSTSAPDGGVFTGFGKFSISGANVAFQGSAANTGVYMGNAGMSALSVVANSLIPAPSGIGYLFGQGASGPGWNNGGLADTSVGGVAVSGDDVAFVATYAISSGTGGALFLKSGGSLRKILGTGDVLFGSSVVGIGVSPTGFDGNRIAFYYKLSDGTRGIAVAIIPTGVIPSLSDLHLSTGALSPMFTSGAVNYTDYTVPVPASTTHLTLTPTAAQPGATITVNGVAVASGAESGTIPLSIGANHITITVTAVGGGTATPYMVTVTRGPRASVATDLKGRGKPDMLFQNNAGQVYAWYLDGTGASVNFSNNAGISAASLLYPRGLGDWRLVGTADMNGDGNPDLVFQNSAGQLYVWFLDGTGATVNFATNAGLKGAGFLYGGWLGDWRVVAIADVNGDGIPDLVFQNNAGQVYAWFLDGTGASINLSTNAGIKRAGFIYAGGLGDWRVKSAADVDGDGSADFVFQNNAGQVYAWYLDGTGATVNFVTKAGFRSAGYLYGGGLGDWRVATVADLNGDGTLDLVFQNNVGQVYAWFLDGTGTPVNFSSLAGLKSYGFLYPGGLGDWRAH